jgi:hypothetical protein
MLDSILMKYFLQTDNFSERVSHVQPICTIFFFFHSANKQTECLNRRWEWTDSGYRAAPVRYWPALLYCNLSIRVECVSTWRNTHELLKKYTFRLEEIYIRSWGNTHSVLKKYTVSIEEIHIQAWRNIHLVLKKYTIPNWRNHILSSVTNMNSAILQGARWRRLSG